MSKIDDVVHKIFNDFGSLTRSDAKRLILDAVGPNQAVASELFTALESVLDGLGAISNHSELSGWVSPEEQEQILGAYRMAKATGLETPASTRLLNALQRSFRGPLNPMDPDPYLSPLQEKIQELLEDAGIDSEIYDAVAKLVEEGERVKASGSV